MHHADEDRFRAHRAPNISGVDSAVQAGVDISDRNSQALQLPKWIQYSGVLDGSGQGVLLGTRVSQDRAQNCKVVSLGPATGKNHAARIGPERAKTSYPWKTFLDDGVRLAFGTDFPVEPMNPFRGVYAAVTRKNEAGTKEFFPEQKITIEQALAAYTTGAAYAQFAEKEKGTLAPGMLADFVVLDRDLTKVAPPEILKTQVLRTVVGGKTVYESSK